MYSAYFQYKRLGVQSPPPPSQTNALQNCYLLLPSMVLVSTRIGQWMVDWVRQFLSKSTDCWITFKWSIQGGGSIRERETCYNGIEWAILLDCYKVIDIGEWSICGGGRLERFYYIGIVKMCGIVSHGLIPKWSSTIKWPYVSLTGAVAHSDMTTNYETSKISC